MNLIWDCRVEFNCVKIDNNRLGGIVLLQNEVSMVALTNLLSSVNDFSPSWGM